MTTSVDSTYGSWPNSITPFTDKYGKVFNQQTGTSLGAVVDPAGPPGSLFINGEQGVWYDPSDFSTLFQDSAGTTPVTAVEQPVGLMLDKSKGLMLGAELVTNPGPFTNTTGYFVLAGATLAATNNKLVITQGTAASYGQAVTAVNTSENTKSYKVVVTIDPSSTGNDFVLQWAGSTFASPTGPGTYTIIKSTQYGATDIVFALTPTQAIGKTLVISSITVKELAGNHALQATAGNRPTLKQDANGCYYLLFNGTSSAMATSSIDFSATDKLTVFAGVRKLSDVARGMVAELSTTTATNNGSFALTAPNSAAGNYAFESKGTVLTDTVGITYTAPITSVLCATGSIAADSNVLRINGVQADSDVGDQGTGNYGNHTLYIGRRGGTSLPFNGHLYSLVIRAAASSASQIASAEAFTAQKTGVTL